MKRDEEHIAVRLSAYPRNIVYKGVNLWKLGNPNPDLTIEESFWPDRESNENLKKYFLSKGWGVVSEPPEIGEFHFLNGEYLVQSKEAHKKEVEERFKEIEKEKNNQRKRGHISVEEQRRMSGDPKKQKAMMGGIKKTEMKCPTCNHTMYKEPICPSCKEGKVGYKIRLMCENNPDHEVLL